MKREIKFRAFHKDSNRMGEPFTFDGIRNDVGESGHSIPEIYFKTKYGTDRIRLDQCEVMQFTGLKDKNGKEIYEGDILKNHEDFYTDPADIGGRMHIKRDVFYLVQYDSNDCCFVVTKKSMHRTLGWTAKWDKAIWFEIVGTIHENPDLLK